MVPDPTCAMIHSPSRLAQAQRAQDKHHHDDQAYKVDDIVHANLARQAPATSTVRERMMA
jgi:hypothetical protein